ncbi:ThiF family adenylyltransferase [Planctomycetota bacterium]
MITIDSNTLCRPSEQKCLVPIKLYHWRDSDVYSIVHTENTGNVVTGTLFFTDSTDPLDTSIIGEPDDQVRLIVRPVATSRQQPEQNSNSDERWTIKGYVLHKGHWQERSVQIIPLQEDLFSRARGILDTPLLSDKRVFIAGLGSVGSFVAETLATCGIMNFTLLDNDRVSVGNLARQNFYVQDVGRFKTKVTDERILGKNPYATVETHEVRATWDNENSLRNLIRQNDIAIVAFDNREGRVILNKLCVEERKPAIFMGAFHRAYGAQILFTREPGISPCYQCFLMTLPRSEKVHGLGNASPAPYANTPVKQFEPGLALDIAAMNTMVGKLCVQQLLERKPTSLRSLDEDLIAPLWIYLNRREGPYAKLPPLGYNVGDGMSILAWYGMELKRNPACPVCGDYEGQMAKLWNN